MSIRIVCTGWAKKNKQILKGWFLKSYSRLMLVFSANDLHYPKLLCWRKESHWISISGNKLISLTPCKKPSQQLIKYWCFVALACGSFNKIFPSTIYCPNSFCHISRGAWWPLRALEGDLRMERQVFIICCYDNSILMTLWKTSRWKQTNHFVFSSSFFLPVSLTKQHGLHWRR